MQRSLDLACVLLFSLPVSGNTSWPPWSLQHLPTEPTWTIVFLRLLDPAILDSHYSEWSMDQQHQQRLELVRDVDSGSISAYWSRAYILHDFQMIHVHIKVWETLGWSRSLSKINASVFLIRSWSFLMPKATTLIFFWHPSQCHWLQRPIGS